MTITRLGQLSAETQWDGAFITDGAIAAAISNTKAKTGAYSYQHEQSTNPMGLGFAECYGIRAGCWVNHIGTSVFDASLFRWHHGSGDEAHFYWDNGTNNLIYLVEGVERASVGVGAANFNRNDEWIHIGVTIQGGVGGYVSFYVDGIQVLTWSGTVETGIDAFYVGGKAGLSGWNSSAYFDDIFVDLYEDELDAAVPSKRFLFALPDAAGANSAWTPVGDTPNFECVDETPPDEDTTYVKALSATLKDTYNLAAITVPTDHVIRAVIPLAIARKNDAGTPSTLKLHSYDGSTYQSSAAKTLPIAYGLLWERQPLQPDGSVWNQTDMNSCQYGVESAGTF